MVGSNQRTATENTWGMKHQLVYFISKVSANWDILYIFNICEEMSEKDFSSTENFLQTVLWWDIMQRRYGYSESADLQIKCAKTPWQ